MTKKPKKTSQKPETPLLQVPLSEEALDHLQAGQPLVVVMANLAVLIYPGDSNLLDRVEAGEEIHPRLVMGLIDHRGEKT
jgi:hypothetical protein